MLRCAARACLLRIATAIMSAPLLFGAADASAQATDGGASNRPQAGQTVTISGVVLGRGDTPVAECLVQAWPASDALLGMPAADVRCVTDDAGHFSLPVQINPTVQTIRVSAHKPGYALAWDAVDTTDTHDLVLPMCRSATRCRGTVTDVAGRPISGASVRLMLIARHDHSAVRARLTTSGQGLEVASTTSDGVFEIKCLPPRCWALLLVVADGYAAVRTEPVDAERTDVAVCLPPEAVLAGRVTQGGRPIANAIVLTSSYRNARADEAGAFILRGLSPGRHSVLVQLPNGTITPAGRDIPVRSGETITGLDLTVPENGTVTGRVTARDQHIPVDGITVRFRQLPRRLVEPLVAFALTDAQGQYTISLPGANRYLVTASLGPHQALYASSVEPARMEIETVPGQQVSVPDVPVAYTWLPHPLGNEIRCTRPDGTPVRNAELYVADRPSAAPATGSSLDDWQLAGTDGSIRVSGHKPPEEPTVYAIDREHGLAAIAVAGDWQAPLDLRLTQGGYVRCRVLDAEGNGIALREAQVWVRGRNDTVWHVGRWRSDETGLLKIGPLPAGVALGISVVHDPWRDRGPAEQRATPAFTLSPGEVREVPPFRIATSTLIARGAVVDEQFQPVPHAFVFASGADNYVRADETGRFVLRHIPQPTAGERVLVAACHPARPLFGIQERPSHSGTKSLIRLKSPESREGVLLDADGQPRPDIAMGAGAMEEPSHPIIEARLSAMGRTTYFYTDADGRWRIDGLIAGVNYGIGPAFKSDEP